MDSVGYYVFLGAVAVFVLGPLGGVTAAYMNFSLGFFVGGQVLAGILGSVITYFYGPEGKHGANYMQTAAASVASMAAMGVLIQAMVWLGLPEPATWKLILYYLCVGLFGIGVGMLYTPILVDKLQLTYPSGLAVANILRALTDVRLLKRSVGQLFTGIGVGAALPLLVEKGAGLPGVAVIAASGLSTSTIGAAMIVGARITLPATLYAYGLHLLTPWFVSQGWLGPKDPARKFAFLIALGMIMGAALVDISLILRQAVAQLRGAGAAPKEPVPGEAWKQTNTRRLIAFVAAAGIAVIVVSHALLGVPLGWVLFAVAFSFLMMLVNGISLGITDSNPISTAFVLSIVSMAALGLMDPIAGLLAGSIVFIVCSIGGDMQQDRSTGWRLGTNRTIQFRYQVVGVLLGAVLAVFMAKLFMEAYPVLKIDVHSKPEAKVDQWQSAMTYKFVGALRGITSPKSYQVPAILVGVAIGVVTEAARKLIKGNARYKAWAAERGFAFDFALDAALLPSPYASSFAGFVELTTCVWWGAGGLLSSAWNTIAKKQARPAEGAEDLPEDMSTTSLVGGGLIAGDSIAALVLGVLGLIHSGALGKIFLGQAPPAPPAGSVTPPAP
ncbi:MAG: OPT/YSL family transporter [Polyangiaceae bacterium]|nr:OPT/YSL family transporter [Polyangiaceae bacterium]